MSRRPGSHEGDPGQRVGRPAAAKVQSQPVRSERSILKSMPDARISLRKRKVPVSPYARAHRLRLYPTPAQERTLLRFLGAARHVWNWGLAHCKAALADKAHIPSAEDLQKRLTVYKRTPGRVWLAEIASDVTNQTLRDLGLAVAAWRAKLRRFPRSKTRGCRSGIRFQIQDRRVGDARVGPNPRIDLEARRITLTGVGAVRWRGSRDRLPSGDITMATVRRVGGQWYVTLPERDTPAPAARRAEIPVVGLDLGVRDAVVTSTGDKTPSPKPLAEAQQRLKRYQRQYARQCRAAAARAGLDPNAAIPRGTRFVRPGRRACAHDPKTVVLSQRAVRTLEAIGRLHAAVADQRCEFQHRTSRQLVDSADTLVIEDLALNALSRSLRRAFRRSVADVGLGELRRQLLYKAQWAGRTVVVVDRWYPSSKTCSACGHVHAGLRLSDRHWTCPACGAPHDRDLNAAINIEREGLRLLAETRTPRSGGTDARGEAASTAIGQPVVGPTSTNRELSYRAAPRRPRAGVRDGPRIKARKG